MLLCCAKFWKIGGKFFQGTPHSQASETTDSPAAMTSLQEICISTKKDNVDKKISLDVRFPVARIVFLSLFFPSLSY